MNKKIFKSAPVALALLALASCTSDDFLGSKPVNGKTEMLVTVEDPNIKGEDMRAAFASGLQGAVWQTTDVFRAYDADLKAYDIFRYNGTGVFLDDESPAVQGEYNKVLFPGDMVYYAGYDKDNKAPIAVMHVSETMDCGTVAVDENNKIGYAGSLPLWADVTKVENGKLTIGLNYLGGMMEVTVYDQSVTNIRVVAAPEGKTTETDYQYAKTEYLEKQSLVDVETPLAGYFEAHLMKDGTLTANHNNPLTKDIYHSYIDAKVTHNISGETHIFIPVIAATYKNLLVQKSTDNGNSWSEIKEYQNETVERSDLYRNGLTVGTAPNVKTLYPSTLQELSKMLTYTATAGSEFVINDGDIVNVEPKADLATDNMYRELHLPNADNVVVNIKGTIGNAEENKPLIITGGVSGKKVTLNIEDGIEDKAGVRVDATCNVVICGTYNSENATSDKLQRKNFQIVGSNDVSLGNGISSFSTNMTVLLGDGGLDGKNAAYTGTLTIDAVNGGVEAIEYTNNTDNGAIVIENGKVGTIGAETPAAGNVTVKGGSVDALTTVGGQISVDGSSKDAKVGNITTADVAITVKEAVVDEIVVGLNANATNGLTLTGGKDAAGKLAKVGKLTVTKDRSYIVTSTDKAALLKLETTGSASNKVTFTSSLSQSVEAKDVKTAEIEDGQIYTAAQLAGIGSGAYTLNTPVTLTGATWTPVNLSGNFALAAATTITGLNAPLFNKVSGTATIGTSNKVLTLTNSTISANKDDQGLLAQVVDGTVTIQYVNVTGTITGTGAVKNYGGLVGRAKGTVALTNNKVSPTITAYANVGGYIGNFEGGTLDVKVTAKTTYNGTPSFTVIDSDDFDGYDHDTKADMLAGTFGYFIGSITGDNATVKIQAQSNGAGATLADYFNTFSDWYSLNFDYNWKMVNDVKKEFKGLEGNEIGFSTVKTLDNKSVLYGVADNFGYVDPLTLARINKYED